MTRCKRVGESGFTLVELSLAVLFIAFIMVFLMSMLIKIMSTYNKGIQVGQINQAVRQINADFADQTRFGKKDIRYDSINQRLCIGDVAYLWNIDSSRTPTNAIAQDLSGNQLGDRYRNGFSGDTLTLDGTSLRLVRVAKKYNSANPNFIAPDYCTGTANPPRPPYNSTPDQEVTILLTKNTSVLKFDITRDNSNRLLSFRIILSTTGNNKARTDNGNSYRCFDNGSHNQYCAFTDLKFYVYQRGKE